MCSGHSPPTPEHLTRAHQVRRLLSIKKRVTELQSACQPSRGAALALLAGSRRVFAQGSRCLPPPRGLGVFAEQARACLPGTVQAYPRAPGPKGVSLGAGVSTRGSHLCYCRGLGSRKRSGWRNTSQTYPTPPRVGVGIGVTNSFPLPFPALGHRKRLAFQELEGTAPDRAVHPDAKNIRFETERQCFPAAPWRIDTFIPLSVCLQSPRTTEPSFIT